MTKWATSGRVKTERAEYHIADLDKRSEGFFDPPPYDHITETDPNTGATICRWHRLPHARNIPPVWGAIAGDAIHNLRSALDVLWRQATNPRPGKRDRRKGAYFPFSDNAEMFGARFSRAKGEMLAASNHVRAFEPWESGNNYLWLLNQASVVDKHEVPTIVTVTLDSANFGIAWPGDEFQLGLKTAYRNPPHIVEDGEVFFRDDRGGRLQMDGQFNFGIAFGECGALKGKAVLPTLHEFACITNAIADAFLREGLIQ